MANVSDDQMMKVVALWQEGKTSVEIGRVLRCSAKRAYYIVERARNLGVPNVERRGNGGLRAMKAAAALNAKVVTARKPKEPRPLPGPAGTVPLLDLPLNSGCRFIAGPADGALYCGAETAPGVAWCAFHRAIVYLPRPAPTGKPMTFRVRMG